MRVIGGQAKGRKLSAPKGSAMRITADRIKESLFDILGPLEGVTFLDLYAGTGNVGIEALSRGAVRVVFVEKDRRHAALIENNLAHTGLAGGKVLPLTVQRALTALAGGEERFDIIFADPPYHRDMVSPTLKALSRGGLLAPQGVVVVEHSSMEPCEGTGALSVADRRRYGDTVITFLNTPE